MERYLGKIGDTVYLNESLRKGTIKTVDVNFLVMWEDDLSIQNVTPRSLYNQEGYDELMAKRAEADRIAALALKPVEAVVPGTVVYLVKDQQAPFPRGKVAGILSTHPTAGEMVIVEWAHGHVEKVALKALFNEVNGKAEESRVLDEQTRIEEEFEATRIIIAGKFQEAAKAIREAAHLANTYGIDIQSDLYDEVDCLEYALALLRGNYD